MLGFVIGLAIRHARPGGTAPPSAPALLIESGSHLLTESGSLLLLE